MEGATVLSRFLRHMREPHVINFEKSAASLSPNSDNRVAQMIQQILNVRVVKEHSVYLGLPTFSLKHKRVQFGFI